MQSRLPDINTAFNTHRKRVILAIEGKRWTECLGSLSSINGALPDDYQVIISDEEYNKMIKQDMLVTCNECVRRKMPNTEFDYSKIKVLTLITTTIGRFVTGDKTVKVWFCPQCKTEQKLSRTPMEQTILKQPYYLGVVTKPPQRKDGLLARVMYDREFERWAWTMLAELEHKMAIYRDANWDRGEENYDNNEEIDTSWEESNANS